MPGTLFGNRRKVYNYFLVDPKLFLNVSKLLVLIESLALGLYFCMINLSSLVSGDFSLSLKG